jgi:hypothetical protein
VENLLFSAPQITEWPEAVMFTRPECIDAQIRAQSYLTNMNGYDNNLCLFDQSTNCMHSLLGLSSTVHRDDTKPAAFLTNLDENDRPAALIYEGHNFMRQSGTCKIFELSRNFDEIF